MTKRFPFQVQAFTPKNFGCVAEIDDALEVLFDDGYYPKKILCSEKVRDDITRASVEGINAQPIISFRFSSSSAPLGGVIINGYKPRLTADILPIEVDSSIAIGFVVEAQSAGERLAQRLDVIAAGKAIRRIELE